jgi:hypothetical protein
MFAFPFLIIPILPKVLMLRIPMSFHVGQEPCMTALPSGARSLRLLLRKVPILGPSLGVTVGGTTQRPSLGPFAVTHMRKEETMSPRSKSKASMLAAACTVAMAWAQTAPAQSTRHVPNQLRPTTTQRQTVRTSTTRAAMTTPQRNSIGFGSERAVTASYIPKSSRMMPIPQESVVAEDGTVYEEVSEHYDVHMDHGCTSCGGGGCDSCSSCTSCGSHGCAGGCLIPCPQVSLRNMEFFAGVDAFKGPQNLGRDGSFGFTAGINTGFKLPCMPCDWFDGQIGISSVHSNYAGADFTPSSRDQLFLTGGLFRRVDYGFQGGVVVDYRSETWYTQTELTQLRGNLSWAYPGGNEIGFRFTTALRDSQVTGMSEGRAGDWNWQVLDTYSFYYQHVFDQCTGTNMRALMGWTGQGNGLFGADFWTPLSEKLALSSSFVYVVPEYNSNPQGNIDETWNVGINLVWYPMGLTNYRGRYHRPMFDVADNGTFFVVPDAN